MAPAHKPGCTADALGHRGALVNAERTVCLSPLQASPPPRSQNTRATPRGRPPAGDPLPPMAPCLVRSVEPWPGTTVTTPVWACLGCLSALGGRISLQLSVQPMPWDSPGRRGSCHGSKSCHAHSQKAPREPDFLVIWEVPDLATPQKS